MQQKKKKPNQWTKPKQNHMYPQNIWKYTPKWFISFDFYKENCEDVGFL